MSMKRKRTDVGSSSSSSSSSKFDDSEVYLLYSLYDGPVRYVMYKLDTSAIGNDDDGGRNNLRRIPNCTPVVELPSEEYPRAMGSFALGSRIYLLGGEVERHRGVDIVCSGGRDAIYLSEKVYFYDTAVSSSSSSPLSVAPPMGGGKKSPLAIQANGLVYVISGLPCTYYSERGPLFEVFNPRGGNEGEGEWSSLPRPPFYPRSCYNLSEGKRIISHAVVGQLICFFTAKKPVSDMGVVAVYAFDVLFCHWEHLHEYKTGFSKPPLRGAVMQVSDSAWVGRYVNSRSPISTFDLSANFGMVGRGVEGLEYCRLCMPPRAYGISYNLLDMRNGWFCLLNFGTVNETMPPYALRVLGDMGGIRALDEGKKYISANVFRLVKRRKDKVSFYESRESSHWLGRTLSPPSDVPRDVSKAVGEIQVYGAEELRSSLFAAGVESFNTSYHLVGFFAMQLLNVVRDFHNNGVSFLGLSVKNLVMVDHTPNLIGVRDYEITDDGKRADLQSVACIIEDLYQHVMSVEFEALVQLLDSGWQHYGMKKECTPMPTKKSKECTPSYNPVGLQGAECD